MPSIWSDSASFSCRSSQLQAGLDAHDLVSGYVLDDPVHARGAEDEVDLPAEGSRGPSWSRRRAGETASPSRLASFMTSLDLLDRPGLDDEGGLDAVYGVLGRGFA